MGLRMNEAALVFAAARALGDLDRGLLPANYVRRPWALVEPHCAGLLHLQAVFSELFRFAESPLGLLWTLDEPGNETAFFLTVWAHRDAMERRLRELLIQPDAAEAVLHIQALAVAPEELGARQQALQTWLEANQPTPVFDRQVPWLDRCEMMPRAEAPWSAAARAARDLLNLIGDAK